MSTERIHDIYRPVEERKLDFNEVERKFDLATMKPQVERCLNCGIPFCHGAGCPLGNLVPDQNRAVAKGELHRAYDLLSVHSDFPEFTSRICPALCEASCVHQLDEESVMIRQTEKLIIETAFREGWVKPRPPAKENGRRVAIIGAGPSGLSAAVTLRRRGWKVTVYEKRPDIGGLLRYGIPNFKLEKTVIDRRRAILEAEGIRFVCGIEIGKDVTADYLRKANDALVVAIGTPAARDLRIPGRDKPGTYLALDFLHNPAVEVKGKKVLVIGGGDTGSDCVGTSIRRGAASVTQIEIMPQPPETRSPSTPWPLWPYQNRTSSSHKEGCTRRFCLNSLQFVGDNVVEGVEVEEVKWSFSPEGRPLKFVSVEGTRETIPCDLVLLAMGFTGVPADNPIVMQLGLAPAGGGGGFSPARPLRLASDPARGIYCVGDCASGASLVVRALASGKSLPL